MTIALSSYMDPACASKILWRCDSPFLEILFYIRIHRQLSFIYIYILCHPLDIDVRHSTELRVVQLQDNFVVSTAQDKTEIVLESFVHTQIQTQPLPDKSHKVRSSSNRSEHARSDPTSTQLLDFDSPSKPAVSEPIVGGGPFIIDLADREGVDNERASACSQHARVPWQVGLLMATPNQDVTEKQCGGVLIDRRWVLTAAHCLENATVVIALVGAKHYLTGFLGDEGQKILVDRVVVHDRYESKDKDVPRHDIALLHLTEDAVFGPDVFPARIPQRNSSLVRNSTRMIISGWGKSLQYNSSVSSDLLRCAHVPVVSMEECVSAHRPLEKKIRSGHVCVGYASGGVGACNGDSGGGLVHRGDDGTKTVVGIISWTSRCGESYTVCTNVQKYRPWLVRNIPELK